MNEKEWVDDEWTSSDDALWTRVLELADKRGDE